MGDKGDMRAILRSASAGAGAVLLLGSVSCGEVARTGRSPSQLVVDSIEAASGAQPEIFGSFLLSDVQTLVEETIEGETVLIPSIYNDLGQATLRVVMKDQGNPVLGVGPTILNAVTITRYRIVYRRADGRNTPGVDVPFPVDGGMTATVLSQPVTVGFEFVRHQAKLEAPLQALVRQGGRAFITTIADVTFYGQDLAGNELQTTASINVSFSDYADPR